MPAPKAVIPSRYGAQRFPGKPLALIGQKPMVQHVYERCLESKAFSEVIVATDDPRIAKAVQQFGGISVMTSEQCASGTDRVAEVARTVGGADDQVFVNVQGDEPAIHPESLAALARAFERPEIAMATLVRPLLADERPNPNVVKVVLDAQSSALYFSRADIPFQRDPGAELLQRWAHLGIYGYRRKTLLTLADLAPTALERTESLEQLRALFHGVRIHCEPTSHGSVAVDRPEDVGPASEAVRALLMKRETRS